ncbi:MAG: hypothetical protein E7116_03805 [Bacteroidales bacterium]|nr:hypothetical protein [Bacteroidales bacterium]
MMSRKNILFSVILYFLSIIGFSAYAQDNIRVQGKITDISSGEAISGVNIIENGYVLTYSDIDGNYSCTVPRDAELIFYHGQYEEIKTKVDNRQVINVQMQVLTIELNEAVVTASFGNTTVYVEPSDLQIVGDHFVLKTTVRIPKKQFDPNSRFIFQPTLYNATLKDTSFFRPVVIDGENYHINQQRYFSFDSSKDRLADYVVTNDLSSTDNIYSYKDSLYVAPTDLDHDYRSDCYIGINGLFRKETSLLGGKTDYSDTLVIAKGTVNPLRFLEYRIDPQELTDTNFIPKPEMKLLMDAGVSKINFVLGKAKVDEKDPESVKNINTIKEKIQAIVNNEFATLKSIEIVGYASPEGTYKQNLSLANDRTELILKELASSLDPSVAKYVTLTSNSVVEPWSKVAEMLKDSDPELSEYISNLVYKYSDTHDHIIPHMRKHKKYRSFLLKDILPTLRKVEYTLNYSEFRKLKDFEIWDRYNAKTEEISRYEYWRLIDTAPDSLTRYNLITESLEQYPNFTYVANDLAVQLIKQDSLNLDLLKPSLGKNAPDEVIYNQALMALGSREVAMADSLARLLPTNDNTAYLKSITAALAGDFEGAYPMLASRGGLNEILILLCMERNATALSKCNELMTLPEFSHNAKFWYVHAVCANRAEDIFTAMTSLEMALMLDPSLEEIARLDSDAMDVIELIRPTEEGTQQY